MNIEYEDDTGITTADLFWIDVSNSFLFNPSAGRSIPLNYTDNNTSGYPDISTVQLYKDATSELKFRIRGINLNGWLAYITVKYTKK